MNPKKILIIAIVVLGLIATSIYILVTSENNSRLIENQNIQNTDVDNTQNYYNELANVCKAKQSEGCCLASVEAMKASNYRLVPQEGCPVGYQPNMMQCIDSYRWCQPAENSVSNTQKQNTTLALNFFAGGSIFGSSFEVKITSAHIIYRETMQDGAKEANKIERSLLPAELDGIRNTIVNADLISLQSQDFTKEPLVPDQASYRISIALDGKENKINCGIPPSGTEPTTKCQKQIDKLRLKLNSMLGVNIY